MPWAYSTVLFLWLSFLLFCSVFGLFLLSPRFSLSRMKFKSYDDEDVDVARERRRVQSGAANNDIMRLNRIICSGFTLDREQFLKLFQFP